LAHALPDEAVKKSVVDSRAKRIWYFVFMIVALSGILLNLSNFISVIAERTPNVRPALVHH
jgi:hypothetical protein